MENGGLRKQAIDKNEINILSNFLLFNPEIDLSWFRPTQRLFCATVMLKRKSHKEMKRKN